jgi:hypothetical protein
MVSSAFGTRDHPIRCQVVVDAAADDYPHTQHAHPARTSTYLKAPFYPHNCRESTGHTRAFSSCSSQCDSGRSTCTLRPGTVIGSVHHQPALQEFNHSLVSTQLDAASGIVPTAPMTMPMPMAAAATIFLSWLCFVFLIALCSLPLQSRVSFLWGTSVFCMRVSDPGRILEHESQSPLQRK